MRQKCITSMDNLPRQVFNSSRLGYSFPGNSDRLLRKFMVLYKWTALNMHVGARGVEHHYSREYPQHLGREDALMSTTTTTQKSMTSAVATKMSESVI